jgi:hypothetical protein
LKFDEKINGNRFGRENEAVNGKIGSFIDHNLKTQKWQKVDAEWRGDLEWMIGNGDWGFEEKCGALTTNKLNFIRAEIQLIFIEKNIGAWKLACGFALRPWSKSY